MGTYASALPNLSERDVQVSKYKKYGMEPPRQTMSEMTKEIDKQSQKEDERKKAFVGESMHETGEDKKPPKMHTGGIVPKTGVYTLQEGEKVIPVAKHKYLRTTIEHHYDGSATVHHEHSDGTSHVKHAVLDLDGVHDSLEDYLRDPEEVEADLEKHGIDTEKLEEAIHPGLHKEMEEVIE